MNSLSIEEIAKIFEDSTGQYFMHIDDVKSGKMDIYEATDANVKWILGHAEESILRFQSKIKKIKELPHE